jgi:hypothetical protein
MRKLLYAVLMFAAVLLLTGANDGYVWGPGAPPVTDDEDEARDDVVVVEVDEDHRDDVALEMEKRPEVERVERVEGAYYRIYLKPSTDIVSFRRTLQTSYSYMFLNVGFEFYGSIEVRGGCFGPVKHESGGGGDGEVWGPSNDDDDDDRDDDRDEGEVWGPTR